jgi:hypothetical protein
MATLRAIALISLTTLLIAACGGSGDGGSAAQPEPTVVAKQSAPVDPDGKGPLPARSNEVNAGSEAASGSSPKAPCRLVTRSQAQTILGQTVQKPVEAPQGPTCIFRSDDGKQFVTLAVQQRSVKDLMREVGKREAVKVNDSVGFCGRKGQQTLYVALSPQRVLSVGAPCEVAQEFAERAMRQLQD